MSVRKRRAVILGATGSIGTSALKVARDIPDRLEIVGVAAQRNYKALADAIGEFRIPHAALADPAGAEQLRLATGASCRVLSGPSGMEELATLEEADIVLIAIVGTAGLKPALAALEAGKDIAVASKEILVMAGEIVMETARRNGCLVLPVDSEHNAIYQCLEHRKPEEISRLILTASGGPFRQWEEQEIAQATVDQALCHPTWQMGRKITVDSATLFNKALEMIEARWLFGVEMDRVDVVVHPQSIIHSMVEFIDGSVLAQLSHSDMCFPIQYAVTWPDRVRNSLRPLDFAALGKLEFEAPRHAVFPALGMARQAGSIGGTLPAVLNAANEIAVEAFLSGNLRFPGIWELVRGVMDAHSVIPHPDLDQILAADAWARVHAPEILSRSSA